LLLVSVIAVSTQGAQRYGIKRPSYSKAEPCSVPNEIDGGELLQYRGGRLITGTLTVNLVFYGTWAPAGEAVTLAQNFVTNIDATDWYKPTQLLKNSNGTRVTGNVVLGKTVFDTGSKGFRLSTADVDSLPAELVKSGTLTYDPDSLTLVISAPDVDVAEYCNGANDDACGYHTVDATSLSQGPVQTGFIGAKAKECGCSPQGGPYGLATDGMIDTIAHEIIETASDPDPPTGWINDAEKDTSENGDKCANCYYNTAPTGTSKRYNIIVGGSKYLVQGNYNVDTNMCDTPCVPEAASLSTSVCTPVVTIPGVPPSAPVPPPPQPPPSSSLCAASTESACTAQTGCIWKGRSRCIYNCKLLKVSDGASACTAKGCRFNPKKGCRRPF